MGEDGAHWFQCNKCKQECVIIERKEDDSATRNPPNLTRPEISQTSEKVGAQGSVSDTPETDEALIPSVELGSTLVDCDFARTLERERDALKLSSEGLIAMLKASRNQLVTRNGLDKDSDNRVAIQINITINAYQQLTQKEKRL